MISNYSKDDANVLVNGLDVFKNPTLEINKKIMVYWILQELLVNVKNTANIVKSLLLLKKTEKNIHIEYTDNGIGAPFDKLILKKGQLNVENRIHAINGTLTFDTTNYKRFLISNIKGIICSKKLSFPKISTVSILQWSRH